MPVSNFQCSGGQDRRISCSRGINEPGIDFYLWEGKAYGRKSKSAWSVVVWHTALLLIHWLIYATDFDRCCYFSLDSTVQVFFFVLFWFFENTKVLVGLIQERISVPFYRLILQFMVSLSLSPFPLLGIPDKENVSSYSLYLASKNCQKVKNNYGYLASKESSLSTLNRAINIFLISFWHLWWFTLKHKGQKADCSDTVLTCPWR